MQVTGSMKDDGVIIIMHGQHGGHDATCNHRLDILTRYLTRCQSQRNACPRFFNHEDKNTIAKLKNHGHKFC